MNGKKAKMKNGKRKNGKIIPEAALFLIFLLNIIVFSWSKAVN
jgi:hypothetical protein